MSKLAGETKLCPTCNIVKPVSLFPKWRTKCKACKATENSARLKKRYASDPKFVEQAKRRAAQWQQTNADRSNEYHRRRHAAKVASGDHDYLLKSSEATKRYYRSEKGKLTTAARMKKYAETGQDKVWRTERRKKPESRTSQLLNDIRNRALKMNIEFSLIFDDVYPSITAGYCQRTGLKFDLATHKQYRAHPFAPSIDRIDSSKGYTPDNVQIVCWAYNAAKNQWGEDVLVTLARAIVAKENA